VDSNSELSLGYDFLLAFQQSPTLHFCSLKCYHLLSKNLKSKIYKTIFLFVFIWVLIFVSCPEEPVH
jgi:hypothetical protein